MKKLATIALAAGLLLGATACGPTEDYSELREQTEAECWQKHWPTYAENIATGFITKADAEGKLARLCISLGDKAVEEAKASEK
jgi:hypothetical protein